MKILEYAPRYWKAILAFVAPACTVILASMQDGSDGGSEITRNEWLTALITAVITAAAVERVANRPPKGQVSDPGISEQDPQRLPHPREEGSVTLGVVVLIVVVVVILTIAVL